MRALFLMMAVSAFVCSAEFASGSEVTKGAQKMPEVSIMEKISDSEEDTILVASLTFAKLAGVLLDSYAEVTLFAPNNLAFNKMPEDTLYNLFQPEHQDAYRHILLYEIVPGKLDQGTIRKMIHEGKGQAILPTLHGESLRATLENNEVIISDSKGGHSKILNTDVHQSNGVIHSIDGFLWPNSVYH